MKKIYLAISLAVCLASAPLTTYAQAKKAKSAAVTMNETQKEKQQFAYGFYKTYMNSLIYQLSDLYMVIAKKFVSPKVLKKTADTGADVLLNAQDCVKENLQTLKIKALNNDWFRVSFSWPTEKYEVIKDHIIYIKIKEQGKSFIIEDATTEMPKLTK
ncbi:hypothetical protein HMPREF0666_00120 [Prevotella sp. C561]|jgi:hypothetical protein|uniref:hypothetical protein n=1 Tax=Prevotella TaxID=838 RepID=UPI0002237AE4|nr:MULTISPECIES: hypothetical protein [Prevotella]EGW48882.1 hypothetical protein HMPREF0666_00120 [Prevotella sp. C561]MBW4772825.1 hypothetical protein [Prevotella jejuni]